MNPEIRQRKTAILGLGGVGGYLGGMFAASIPHLTVVARGGRYDSIKENGIVLHSDLNGEICARPENIVKSASELEEQDYLFISVKNYSLESAVEEIKKGSAVGSETVIIPVMNGVDCGDRLRAAFPDNPVVDSVIYIVSMARDDYSIDQQGDFADLRFGIRDFSASEITEELSELFKTAGIRHKISKDVMVDIWRKYILNCAYNVATAAWDLPIGGLREDPSKAEDYASLAREAYHLGLAKNIALKEEHVISIIDKFSKYADNATSSLQRDIHDGKPAELDTFSGYVVREGKRLGVPVPVSERYYEMLLKKL